MSDRKLGAIQENLDTSRGSGYVVGATREERHDVVIETIHLELVEVGVEGDAREVLARVRLDLRVARLAHVVLPRLLEGALVLLRRRLQHELCAEDVAQFRSVSVPAACTQNEKTSRYM